MTAQQLWLLGRTRAQPGDVDAHLRVVHHHRLLLLKSLYERVNAERDTLPASALRDFAAHWELLERAEAHSPGSTRHALAYPTVGSRLVRALYAREPGAFGAELALIGQIAAAAALRSGCPFELVLPAPEGELVLPGVGGYECPSGELRLEVDAGAGPEPARAPAQLPGGHTVLDDIDPCHTPPDGGLSQPPAAHTAAASQWWSPLWREAMDLLFAADPQRAREVAALTRCLVPLTPLPEGPENLYSATLRASPGAVLTTPPEDASVLAEVLVHEIQHTKLAVLCDLTPLYFPGGPAVHKVPWRTDPRPIGGLLQGAYAHLALTDLWHRIAGTRGTGVPATVRRAARSRHREYRDQVAEVLPTLAESAELTDNGRELVSGMAAHHRRLGSAGNSVTMR
ncbi:aKG-HExxH-type peptide beta-hydroxylase [Streptomyces marispadix]|uniref:HEXXH motif-containing putative peptide modification protein n=1 Tax=Streptomyces marispadix TaxID=2922868 RepID=A0ABS9T1W7_9ACTN|nr:HEXXH motif-containing putative peptide modification protein [Streptomyces marispadix]MCH6162513.1 HEXXH motif-containing putative peptide modification protein [Streptomyces marispadix]